MRLSIRIAGDPVFISYAGQPKSCLKCGDVDHLVQGCKNPRCFNCEAPGQRSADCTLEPLCDICMEPGHPVAECPFLRFSANVANKEDQFVSYADMAKENPPAPRAASAAMGSCQSKKPSRKEPSRKEPVKESQDQKSQDKSLDQNTAQSEKSTNKSDERGKNRVRKRSRKRSSEDDPDRPSERSSKSKCDRGDHDRDRDHYYSRH